MGGAVFISMFMGLFVAVFIPLMLLGKAFKEAQAKARARRIADAKMNARLPRLDL